jgi:DNA-binding PadR family transcriptional regulator
MHPYEMGVILRQRHKEESIKLRYGSLYTVIDFLLKEGLIIARETAREGRRPERTVYEITPAGSEELRAWMADLLARPVKEYPQFEAALCLLPVLPPDEALLLLRKRLHALEQAFVADLVRRIEGGWGPLDLWRGFHENREATLEKIYRQYGGGPMS